MSKEVSKAKKGEVFDRKDGYFWEDTTGQSKFDIPPSIAKELAQKKYEGRWLNAKLMLENQGVHRSGWKIYKSSNPDKLKKMDEFDFSTGVDVDGYVRRGDMILGIKPVELQERHKQRIRAKTEAQDIRNIQKKSAQVLRDTAKEGNLNDFEILEGYDENS